MFNTFVKYKYLFVALFALLLVFCAVVNDWGQILKCGWKINTNYQPNNDNNVVRIYYDIATTPTLYQVEDFLNQSEDSIIFVRWDRIPNLEEKLKNRKNVHVIKQVDNNGWKDAVGQPIVEYYKNHPDSKFVIHANMIWIKNLMSSLRLIPNSAIKEIHVYEDGAYFYFIESLKSERMVRAQQIFYDYFKDVPKIVHMENTKRIASPLCIFDKKCREVRALIKNDVLADTSVKDLRQKLQNNPEKADAYFGILGFDYKKYQREMKRPNAVFIFTVSQSMPFVSLQLSFLNELMRGNLNYLINDKNVKWYYKPHPEKHQRVNIEDVMKKHFPNVELIEKHIPLELFVIAGITPDYVTGFSSGAYLNMPKDNIAAFVARPGQDPYLAELKRNHQIRKGRDLKLTDCDNSENSLKNRKRSKFWVSLDNFFSSFRKKLSIN